MKSFIRWSAALGIVGSTLIGSSLLGNLKALALPAEQIMPKLQPVPVFAITDSKGAPLVASLNQGQKKGSVAGVFISQRDAQAFIEQLKKTNAQLAGSVRVSPVTLAHVFKLQLENKNKPDGLNFAYVPKKQQVEAAMAILRQSDPKVANFPGTPLFVARSSKDKGYLTVPQGNQQVIPFFFDKEQLQNIVDRFKKQQPSAASTIQIQPVSLENVLDTLSSSNDKQLNNIVIVPSAESMDFLRSLKNSGANQQPRQQGGNR